MRKKIKVNLGVGLNMFFPETIEIDLSDEHKPKVPKQIMEALLNAPEVDGSTINQEDINWVDIKPKTKKTNSRKKNKS